MKKYFFCIICLTVTNCLNAQNIGIGTSSPQTTLHIVSSIPYPLIVDGGNQMFMILAEGGINRGYIGSYAGNAEDVDFGTFSGNTFGKLHFTIQDIPKMTIDANGWVGIGTTNPSSLLEVYGNTGITGYFLNTGSGTGVLTYSNSTPGSGYGVAAYGGYTGVQGIGNGSGIGDRIGLAGFGNGGTGSNYGAYLIGNNGTNAYGVYATASAGGINWAGYFAGSVFASFYSGSDRKLKNDIKPLSGALAIINQLNPSFYTYKTKEYKQMNLPEGIHYGLIADEVQQVLPGTVKKAVQPAEYENGDQHNGKKLNDEVAFDAINYTEMIPILIAAMKEQQAMIGKQQQQINELVKEIQLLKVKQ